MPKAEITPAPASARRQNIACCHLDRKKKPAAARRESAKYSRRIEALAFRRSRDERSLRHQFQTRSWPKTSCPITDKKDCRFEASFSSTRAQTAEALVRRTRLRHKRLSL